jgi:hypothetical protein
MLAGADEQGRYWYSARPSIPDATCLHGFNETISQLKGISKKVNLE